MALQNLLPPHVPYKNMVRLMSDAFQIDPAGLDELNLSAPIMHRLREADGDTFAPELDAHGPGLCLAVDCTELRCVALRNNILARHGYNEQVVS